MGKKELLKNRLDITYVKPNILIHAKYDSSLREEQILAWALAHTDAFVLEEGSYKYTFPAGVLREIVGSDKSHSFVERCTILGGSFNHYI